MAFIDGGFGSIHFRREAEQIVSHPLSVITAPIQSTVTALRKTGAELKRAKPLVTSITKALLNPITAAKIGLNPRQQMQNIGGALRKQPSASSQDTAAQTVYQDSNHNPITKEQYDYLVAQQNEASQAPQDVYQDENKNVITKAQYDAIMAQQNIYTTMPVYPTDPMDPSVHSGDPDWKWGGGTGWRYLPANGGSLLKKDPLSTGPMQTQQSTVSSGDGGDSSPMQTAPVDITSGDVLDQQVQTALLAIKSKAASGGALTANEKDFVSFMAKATVQVGPISGFGFYPIWPKKNLFPILPITNTDERLFSEDEELPSFNNQEVGTFSSKENFEGLGEWCKI